MMGTNMSKKNNFSLETYGEKKNIKKSVKRDWASLSTASEAVDMMITGFINMGTGGINIIMAIFFVIAFAFSVAFDGLGDLMKSKKKSKKK